MEYQLIIFLSKKELMAVDITEDGDCEEISIDGNPSMNYRSVEDFDDFKQYICDAYNVDEIEEMEAGATIVNCGADAETSIALQEELKDFKGIDSIDVKKLLPVIAQNKGLLKKGGKNLFNVMGNCFAVKCDDEGVTKVSKNKVSDAALELTGADFSFLYFFKGESSGISEEEIVAAAEQAAEAEIAAVEAKYANIIKEHAEFKKIVDELEATKKKNAGKFANLQMGEIVKFGKYYINDSKSKSDIEWRVLDVEKDKVLLITDKCIEYIKYDNNYNNKWENCSLRKWLNGMFLKLAFSEEEISNIIDTVTETNTESRINISDKVFIMNAKEAEEYFLCNKDRIAVPTSYTVSKGARQYTEYGGTGGKYCYWWLREPYDCDVLRVIAVSYTGETHTCYNDKSPNDYCSIRPAVWVKK